MKKIVLSNGPTSGREWGESRSWWSVESIFICARIGYFFGFSLAISKKIEYTKKKYAEKEYTERDALCGCVYMKKTFEQLKKLLYRFLLPMSGIFMILILLFFLISGASSMDRKHILILLFVAAGVSLTNLVFFVPKVNLYFRVSTHFVGTGLVLLGMIYFSGYMNRSEKWVLLLVAYLILYALVCPIVLLVYLGRKKKKMANKTYTSIYK